MRKHITNIRVENEENEINLTPMLDVVFIMIFFIVTASFLREAGLDTNRPDQDQPVQTQDEEGAILVIVDETDDIWIDNRIIDPRAVRPNIQRLHAENPDRPVVVQVSASSRAETLVTVMDASRQADVYDISIAEAP